ncbi:PREDICTED: heterogeneous nuclear ribonucleoprotein 1-like isoform X2 [Lupinus angustifolius]|uniref:heterogeneous nuclear ribonucleoprotein 1-like isoform X1 n=2 Tax=Lupinus angustifolius TaxID=3871 RepID=UPI00092EDA71|nr:PREDICTED: heterogeneous nuclear ribonucleoprotein 1-like isoform X1 [Lupinus angustifolius]XP_019433753.1 PREDICTED: heterogeneous nuclear ribonucleoprotein 1-like isoform X2 [Lupinus angustifolius]
MMESDLGKLFIGGISWDTDEERLKEYFGKYGEVIEAVIMRDRTTGRARGFGFVVFADPAVAERVIMDKHIIDGRTVEAKKAVPRDDQQSINRQAGSVQTPAGPGRTKKIFVGGLPSTIIESDFKKYFDQFGIITDVVVMYDRNTQRPRGFGFITFDSEEAVERVLYKTFHELSGKMVEIKRAVPKELSPGPNRSPLIGYNYGLNRGASSFLNSYAQGYNMSPLGGYGVRMDGGFSPLASGRSGFSPFGNTAYGMGVNLDSGLSPSYGGASNYGSNLGYGRIFNPLYNSNSSRYTAPIGYSGGNGRSDSLMNSPSRNVWGNGGLNNANNAVGPGAFLGSGSGNFGVSIGNNGTNWGPSFLARGGGAASGHATGSNVYEGGDSSLGLGGAGYGRNSGIGVTSPSTFNASTVGYEGSYEDLYRSGSGSAYNDSTWRSATSEIDGSASFGYGLGGIASDDPAKSSEGYVGNYHVTNRQSTRGMAV